MRRSAAKSVPTVVQPAESHPAHCPLRRLLGACALALAVPAPAHAAINVNKTFTPDAVAAGQPSKVTFYFLNNNIVDATSVQFVDPLPSPMQVAPTPNAVSNCGGTLTASPGATSVSFTGGTVPKVVGTTPGQCELSFDVIVATANVLINSVPAGEVTTSQGPLLATVLRPAFLAAALRTAFLAAALRTAFLAAGLRAVFLAVACLAAFLTRPAGFLRALGLRAAGAFRLAMTYPPQLDRMS